MRMRDVISEARQFATEFLNPLNRQVDPLHFGTAHRALEQSVEYGKRIMTRYAYRNWSEEEIRDCLQRLTWSYPSHLFVIDYQEAQEMNLKVSLLEGEREDDAHAIVDTMEDCVGFLAVDFPPETETAPVEAAVEADPPEGGSDGAS